MCSGWCDIWVTRQHERCNNENVHITFHDKTNYCSVTQPNLLKFPAIKINFLTEVLNNSYCLSNNEIETKDKTGGRVARVEATQILIFRNTRIKETSLKKVSTDGSRVILTKILKKKKQDVKLWFCFIRIKCGSCQYGNKHSCSVRIKSFLTSWATIISQGMSLLQVVISAWTVLLRIKNRILNLHPLGNYSKMIN